MGRVCHVVMDPLCLEKFSREVTKRAGPGLPVFFCNNYIKKTNFFIFNIFYMSSCIKLSFSRGDISQNTPVIFVLVKPVIKMLCLNFTRSYTPNYLAFFQYLK